MKKSGLFVIVLGLLILSLGVAQAAPEANTGIMGRIVDGATAQPWEYGAEVMIIQTTGTAGLKGSTVLAADGTFSIVFGTTDDLGICTAYGGCTAGTDFANYRVLINFICDFETTTTGQRTDYQTSTDASCPTNQTLSGNPVPLSGLPNNFEVNVTDTFVAQMRNIGDLDTNRGPTAVSLETFTVENESGTAPLLAMGMALILLGTALVIYRRQKLIR